MKTVDTRNTCALCIASATRRQRGVTRGSMRHRGFKPKTGDEVGSIRGGLRRHRGASERVRPLTLPYPPSGGPKLFEPRKLSIRM